MSVSNGQLRSRRQLQATPCDLQFHPVDGVGLDRIELSASALSVLRSNRLSYSPGDGSAYRPGVRALPPHQTIRIPTPLRLPPMNWTTGREPLGLRWD